MAGSDPNSGQSSTNLYVTVIVITYPLDIHVRFGEEIHFVMKSRYTTYYTFKIRLRA